jgi:radical SAM superfamily enzyme YgiQ (UPF0313 family)
MKIELIYPDISSFHGINYHPGLASIAATLIAKGHDVGMVYFDNKTKVDSIIKHIRKSRPALVGFTSVETQFCHAAHLARKIKESTACVIVCGGPYVTLVPEVILEQSCPFDALVIGEGEYAIAELADKLEKGQDWLATKNLSYRDTATGRLVRNDLNPLIMDLDLLPHPSKELFSYQDIIDRENIAIFHFNRGCPYHCSFCSNAALGRVYGMSSNPIRYKSVERAMDEIDSTLSKYRLRDDTILEFGDDLFIANKKWLSDFCALYKKYIKRPFWCTGRSNHITKETCKILKDAGCKILMMSVESGNDYIRNEVMFRDISRETLFRSFDLCHKYGINTLATCIVGLPFETPEMIEDSIRTVARLKSISSYGINVFYPYKGTHLRTVCEEKGYMPDGLDGSFIERKESALNLPGLPKETIAYYYKNWVGLVMRHKGIVEQFKYTLRNNWDTFRKTKVGKTVRRFMNDTDIGKRIKRYAIRHVWNRV